MRVHLPLTLLLLATQAIGQTDAAWNFSNAQVDSGATHIQLDLGTKRANWNHGRWSSHIFDKPLDLQPFNAIKIIVHTTQPRHDAELSIALDLPGATYIYPSACSLIKPENQAILHFKNFLPEHHDGPPSWTPPPLLGPPSGLQRISIGIINSMGIGTVDFTIREIKFLTLKEQPTPPATIHVTGSPIEINGTTNIPVGLFASFNLPNDYIPKYRISGTRSIHHTGLGGKPRQGSGATPIHINTLGDRVRPSVRLTEAKWKERTATTGKQYGEAAAANTNYTTYVEYWNEPYLNWANKNRAGFIPRFYDQSQAKEGGPVHILHDGQEAPHLRWTTNYHAPPWQWLSAKDWRRGKDSQGTIYSTHAPPYKGMNEVYGGKWMPDTHPPENIPDGEPYTAIRDDGSGLKLTAFTPWHIYDETQFTFWSGSGMLKFYIEPMLAFGEAYKKACPTAIYIAGWGMRPSEDHWAAWHLLYKPTIDAGIHLIDGVCDHDYGGAPERMSANYEFITSYAMVHHNKWLYGYNTETGANTDPQAYAQSSTTTGESPHSIKLGYSEKAQWLLRKMIHSLHTVPDKARVYLHFGTGGGFFDEKAEGSALTLLNNLRGRLIQTTTDQPHIHTIAAIDGTDPLAPRPPSMPEGKEFVLAILNNSTTHQPIHLTIDAPTGATFATTGIQRTLDPPPPGLPKSYLPHTKQQWADALAPLPATTEDHAALAIIEKPISGKPNQFTLHDTLHPFQTITISIPITETDSLPAQTVRSQIFLPIELARVTPKEKVSGTIKPTAQLRKASKLWLRIVAERIGETEATFQLATHSQTIPPIYHSENTPVLLDIPLDATKIIPLIQSNPEAEIPWSFSCSSEQSGYLICAASLMMENSITNQP